MNTTGLNAAAVVILSLACGVAVTAKAEGLGTCAWTKAAGGGERDAFLSAYARGQEAGMAQLASTDARLMQYVAQCASRSDLPRPLTQVAITSVAVQDAASMSVQASSRISRLTLDTAWAEAPAAARDCTRANAAKLFGLSGPSCPDPKAPLWFLQRFGASSMAEGTKLATASEVLRFMNSKAQEELAESLITRFTQRQTP